MSANWEQYFERHDATINGKHVNYYEYKDKSVKTLPDNLPMPPTDIFYRMFYNCYHLQDITALSNWDVSNVENMYSMFYGCCELGNITALSNWDVSNVKDMRYMFSYCDQLQDITALVNWDISKAENMGVMFYQCKLLSKLLHNDVSYGIMYLSKYRHRQQISELQKENAELKTRLAYLEEKVDILTSRFSETVQWNP